MPLNKKYHPFNVHEVLSASLTVGPLKESYGGAKVPLYYTNDRALVLYPVTDKIQPNPFQQKLRTIDDGLSVIKSLPEDQRNKTILIPVTEEQKIFGIFPRNHWVTVQFDPATKTATILDSRPWIVSMIYPTKSMEKMLRAGLTDIYGDFKIKKIYQGVQHNDIYCGAWTTTNIRDLFKSCLKRLAYTRRC